MTVRRNIGHEPTFDDLRYNSNLGIEYYIRNFGSLSKFKESIGIENKMEKEFNDLQSDYYKIKKLLGMTPTYTQMCKYSKNFHTITIQFADYFKFLEAIGESVDEVKNIQDDIGLQKQKELLKKYDEYLNKIGKFETMKILSEDEEIPYKEWFGGKQKFIKALGLNDPSLTAAYAKVEAQKLISSAKIESQNVISAAKSKFGQIVSNRKILSKAPMLKSFLKPKIPVYNLKKCPRCHKAQLQNAGKDRKSCFNCGWNSWTSEQY
jgi:ribosomal protein S27AE